jgi:hypothetical protein
MQLAIEHIMTYLSLSNDVLRRYPSPEELSIFLAEGSLTRYDHRGAADRQQSNTRSKSFAAVLSGFRTDGLAIS